jgi:hypothetical protein
MRTVPIMPASMKTRFEARRRKRARYLLLFGMTILAGWAGEKRGRDRLEKGLAGL